MRSAYKLQPDRTIWGARCRDAAQQRVGECGGAVGSAARAPKLIEEAVAEANRMAREQVDPLRKRVEQLRRELGEAEDQAGRLLSQILSAGIGSSPTAKRLLAEAEGRQGKLGTALAAAEGELAGRETEYPDQEVMIAALQGFDVAFDCLTLAEKREFLQLMCRQVDLFPDRLEVELYEGRRAMALLTSNKRLQQEGADVSASVSGEQQRGAKATHPGTGSGVRRCG